MYFLIESSPPDSKIFHIIGKDAEFQLPPQPEKDNILISKNTANLYLYNSIKNNETLNDSEFWRQ